MIHVQADQNLYRIEELISPQVQLTLYDPSEGIPHLANTDALLVRTVTHLNEQTLPEIPKQLKFIGTGSSGTDHLDNEYLESKGITLASANGCNARAVAEYVITAMLLWKEKYHPKISFGRVGVVGVGKAGSAVVELLDEFGIDSVKYDPPRQERDPDFSSASLQEVLDCDILTFHVPLNRKEPYPTFHWLDEDKLAGQSYDLVINAARGGVIDELAMMKHFVEGKIQQYVLDVWENEPDFNTKVAKQAFIATPHIAGYSEQAKVNATRMIREQLSAYFGLSNKEQQYEVPSKIETLKLREYNLTSVLDRLHPILGYHKALLNISQASDKNISFQKLRNEWPYRLEYSSLKVADEVLRKLPELSKLGITSW